MRINDEQTEKQQTNDIQRQIATLQTTTCESGSLRETCLREKEENEENKNAIQRQFATVTCNAQRRTTTCDVNKVNKTFLKEVCFEEQKCQDVVSARAKNAISMRMW